MVTYVISFAYLRIAEGQSKELNSSIRTAARVDLSIRLCGACPCARHSFVLTTVLGVDTVIPT